MATLRQSLQRLTASGRLLREIKGLRLAAERIAAALEASNAHQWPQHIQSDPSQPPVEVSYADTAMQAEFMEIELGLTEATGLPPTEDQVMAEWLRRHPDAAAPGADA